jgi:hypothetical protein
VNFADAEKIAAAVLYEGYILYPYRASSIKNTQRWNFGTLYPKDYADVQRPAESYRLLAECLVQTEVDTLLDVRFRFLQLMRRQGAAPQDWEEGIERSTELMNLSVREIQKTPFFHSFFFSVTDGVTEKSGMQGSPLKALSGRLTIRAELLRTGLHKLSLELVNLTPMQDAIGCSAKDAMLEAFVSAHLLLSVSGGEFVSLLDTPEQFRQAVAECRNVGVFPVLVGAEGQRSMMLCSPIILYDYPQIAPESAGDFFDGTEMDEMLALRVMTLTDAEKEEMRNVDDRARMILERTESMPQDFLMKVHGAIRGLRAVPAQAAPRNASVDTMPGNGEWDPFAEKPPVASVRVFGTELRTGSRVRLWPQKKADIMDMALEGKVAVIEAIEQDLEDNIQLAVVLDDDPGREFGMMRQPGHRFFFSPEEVEPVQDTEILK